MNRFNFSPAGGTSNFERTVSTVVFAGILILCSVAVGCSSEKPKTQGSNNQPAMAQPSPTAAVSPTTAIAPEAPVAGKPVHKKVVRKAPATVTYSDPSSGVSFQYPRRYALKTGDDADKLVSSDAVPMDFVQPGGVTLAAVAVPESAYPKSDLASAFFNVSVNKALTETQCGDFSVPQPKAEAGDAAEPAAPRMSKLMIGDMELQSTETLAKDGAREETAKYYHVFENGACYEFALTVATGVETDEGGKHVDREEIFKRLEKILATVKINPAPAPEVTASTPVTSAVPAQ
jgi:hypothetical protein